MTLHSEWPIFHIWTATSPLNRPIVSISISQLVRYMLGFARPGWTLASQQTSFGVRLACVAWRFCREHYAKTRAKACANERRIREKNITHVFFVVPAPISSWFLGPRPPDRPTKTATLRRLGFVRHAFIQARRLTRPCLRWLNTVLRAVSGNSRDGARFKLDKQTWRGKK